jgi:hypothetical protein
MGNQILCRTTVLHILEDTGLGFSFYLWDSLTRELLLGLLGWREKCGFVSPLSESPLGQPLVPRSDQERGLTMGLSFLPMIPSSRAPRKQGKRVIQLKGKKKEGMSGLSIIANWKCCYHQGCKIQGTLSFGCKILCHV